MSAMPSLPRRYAPQRCRTRDRLRSAFRFWPAVRPEPHCLRCREGRALKPDGHCGTRAWSVNPRECGRSGSQPHPAYGGAAFGTRILRRTSEGRTAGASGRVARHRLGVTVLPFQSHGLAQNDQVAISAKRGSGVPDAAAPPTCRAAISPARHRRQVLRRRRAACIPAEDQLRRDADEDPRENLAALELLFVVALLKTVADLFFMRTHGVIELRTYTCLDHRGGPAEKLAGSAPIWPRLSPVRSASVSIVLSPKVSRTAKPSSVTSNIAWSV